jgi:hypothetical protein
MKAKLLFVLLAVCNIGLAIALGSHSSERVALSKMDAPESVAVSEEAKPMEAAPKAAPAPATEYAAIYSSNSKKFVENLRAIGCPEETIKDILIAEIGRRHAAQEEALRPTPADHVPNGWSARTVEGKLIARRQEAARIARAKAAELREALGFEVAVQLPNYAMTTSDQAFEAVLNSLPPEKRAGAQRIHENYWNEVEQLRERTRGFWLAEDVAALEELKARRQAALNQIAPQ